MEEVAVQPRTHLAIGRQWKSRSVLLLPNFSREKPPPVAPGPVIQHDGPVMQLSGKGLLVPGSWKRRYCVLDGRRLYYYHLNGENQDCHHYRDKTSHYVDLDNYDICEEAKGIKTASNVLVISSSEIEKSFFDTGRLYLSAETAKEMNEWITQIRSAMSALRNGPKAQSPPKSSKSADVSTTCSTEPETPKMNATDILSETSISLLNSGEHLDCITKQRAKGPMGRRLPRHAAKSRLYPAAAVQQQRSESLPRLELQTANSDPVNIRLGHIKHATIIPGNRLINRMLELDSVVDESTVVVDPLPPPTEDDIKQIIPDHSTFDQSWFLETRASSGLTSPQTQLIECGGAEQCDDVAQSSPASIENSQTGVTTSRPTNRYWPCNFL